MKILVLSHYFSPEPITKPLEIAEALTGAGHEVQVLTGFPNYPDGRIYPGFRLKLFQRDRVGLLPVLRIWMYPSHGTSRVGRLLNYGTFMLSSIAGGLAAGRFDAMYVWHPPLSIGVAAAAIGALRRRPFVYDVLDIWPESAVATGFLRPGRIYNALGAVERFVYRRAARIFVVTEGARQNLLAKGVAPQKIIVEPPWYDDEALRATSEDDRQAIRADYGWRDAFVVMFAGNMGILQGLDGLLRTLRLLPPKSRVQVALVGDGMDLPRLKGLAEELELGRRVAFVDRQPPEQMARYYAAADALFVQLRPSPIEHYTIPAKTIAYLAAGKPILVASSGAAAEVVSRAGAGVVVPPNDPLRLAEALTALERLSAAERAAMGDRGKAYFDAHFRRETIIPAYVAALESVAGGGAGGA